MKFLTALALSLCAVSFVFAQPVAEPRVIEVSGSAERLITPDEFTFKITIAERLDKKDKITIEQQETSLRTGLQKIGIDAVKDLTVFDVSSTYIPRKKVRDVLGTKDYRLKVRDINKIAPLVELVDRINISKLDLINTEHSEITRFRREVKMDAIKAAKEKADYLLGAIGVRAGKPVYVKEVEEATGYTISGLNSNSNSIYSNNVRVSTRDSDDDDDALSFAPIRLRFVIQAKFEIE